MQVTALVALALLSLIPPCADASVWAGPLTAAVAEVDVADSPDSGGEWSHVSLVSHDSGAGPADDLERLFRRLGKTLSGAVSRWSDDWLPRILVFALLALLMPIFDWSVFGTLATGGPKMALRSAALAVLVYVRLLADARSPLIGKALVAFGVVYGVALRDLMPDAFSIGGQLDDFLVLLVGAKAFATMCPKGLVEQHARIAARKLRGSAHAA